MWVASVGLGPPGRSRCRTPTSQECARWRARHQSPPTAAFRPHTRKPLPGTGAPRRRVAVRRPDYDPPPPLHSAPTTGPPQDRRRYRVVDGHREPGGVGFVCFPFLLLLRSLIKKCELAKFYGRCSDQEYESPLWDSSSASVKTPKVKTARCARTGTLKKAKTKCRFLDLGSLPPPPTSGDGVWVLFS